MGSNFNDVPCNQILSPTGKTNPFKLTKIWVYVAPTLFTLSNSRSIFPFLEVIHNVAKNYIFLFLAKIRKFKYREATSPLLSWLEISRGGSVWYEGEGIQ